jgi:integrase/recombinase XerC
LNPCEIVHRDFCFAEVVTGFLTYLAAEKRYSDLTVRSYSTDLHQFSNYLHKQYQSEILESRNDMVRSWMAQLIHQGVHPNSVHRKVSALSAFFRYCVLTGIRDDNPCAHIKKPKRPSRLPVFLDANALTKLYAVISTLRETHDLHNLRDALLLKLLIETGMRRAEIIDLKSKDVDYSYKQLRVLGKRRKMRIIPVSDELIKDVIEYQKIRDQPENESPCDSLLIGDSGKKMSTSFVHSKIHDYLSQVTTLNKKSPHVMRHSFATAMLNNGADLQSIRELLGHSSLAATQVYTHNSIIKLQHIHRNKHPRA